MNIMATDVVTGIDSLLNYINKNGEVDTTTLASVLGVSEGTVLEWSAVLEKAKLILIVYKLGKMYVSPTTTSISIDNDDKTSGVTGDGTINFEGKQKVNTDEIKKLNDIKTAVIQDNLKVQGKNIEALNNKIKEFNAYMKNAEETMKTNEPIIKNTSAELLGFRTEASKNINGVVEYMNQVEAMIQQLKTGSFDFSREYLSFENVDLVSKNARAIIDDIRSKASYMHSSVNDITKEFDKRINEERTKILEFRDNVKNEEKVLNNLADNIQKQLSKYNEKLEEYKREAAETNIKVKKERGAVLDKALLAKQRIDRIYSTGVKKFEGVDEKVSEELEKLKKIDSMYQEINQIRQELEELTKEGENTKKEIAELSEILKRVGNDKKETPFGKYKKILEGEKKVKEIDDKVGKLNGRLSKIGKDEKEDKKDKKK